MTNINTIPKSIRRILEENETYIYAATNLNTSTGFRYSRSPSYPTRMSMMPMKPIARPNIVLPTPPNLYPTEVHRNDIYLGSYKFFAGQEPLEFTTLGFTEMKNEMEVL